jgi:hypothetical protein
MGQGWRSEGCRAAERRVKGGRRVRAAMIRRGRRILLAEARRVRCLDEVLSSKVRRRAKGRVIFRA